MKKFSLLIILAFLSSNLSFAKDNYGFIDLPYILNKYSVSVSFNNAVKQKEAEIQKMLNSANSKIVATKDVNSKKIIEANAKKQIQPKLDSLVSYKKQQNAKIEAAINVAISKVAKTYNYDLILSGNSVVYGATNVSDLILKELNKK